MRNLVLTPLPVAQTGLGDYIPKTKWNYYINVAFAHLFLFTYMYLYIYICCFYCFWKIHSNNGHFKLQISQRSGTDLASPAGDWNQCILVIQPWDRPGWLAGFGAEFLGLETGNFRCTTGSLRGWLLTWAAMGNPPWIEDVSMYLLFEKWVSFPLLCCVSKIRRARFLFKTQHLEEALMEPPLFVS